MRCQEHPVYRQTDADAAGTAAFTRAPHIIGVMENEIAVGFETVMSVIIFDMVRVRSGDFLEADASLLRIHQKKS